MKKEQRIPILVATIASVGAATFVSSYMSKRSNDISLESLQKIASQYAKGLPMMVDKETQLEAVGAAESEIIYSYRLINVETDSSLQSRIVSMKQGMINRNCSTPETRDNLLNKGITMKYDYYDKNRMHITSVEIKPSDCR